MMPSPGSIEPDVLIEFDPQLGDLEMTPRRRSFFPTLLAIFGLIVLGALLIPGIVMVIAAIPDIRRYLHIRSM